VDRLFLPVDGLFEAGACVEVVDDGEYGNWANG
jgi:hypothetical protein